MYNIAQTDLGETFFGGSHPLESLEGVSLLVGSNVSNAIVVAGVILLFIIIYAGYSMISASGDPQQFQRAQLILTSGIVGFIIVIAAWFIVQAIQTSTGLDLLE